MFNLSVRAFLMSFMILVCCACGTKAPSSTVAESGQIGKNMQVADCMPPLVRVKLYIAWNAEKEQLFSSLRKGARIGKPTALYNAQGFTNNLLKAAAACGDLGLLSELAAYVAIPFDYLKVREGIHTWADEQGEVVNTLSRSQFLYLVSRAVNIIVALPEEVRTEAMDELLKKAPKVAYEHYQSWIIKRPSFQVTGWGCHGHDEDADLRAGRYYHNHHAFLKYKRAREFNKDGKGPQYCNAIGDTDMWIASGLVELLAAHNSMPKLFKISTDDRNKLDAYLAIAIGFIEDALVETQLVDFQGKAVRGVVVEPGIWSEHSENAYSAYTGTTYPTEKNKRVAPNLSWDISHARRLVHVMGTLYRNRAITDSSFPDESIMGHLANQYAYGVFDKNFRRPLFTNFFDGNNGWYRVGYAGRKNFGYGPYKLSNAAVTGGFGFWKKYNPNVAKINEALWRMLQSDDPKAQAFVEKYYHAPGYARNIALIQFLPVFVKVRD